MDCAICCEGFTKMVRKPIHCSNCDFLACVRCHERFILDSNTESKCLNCNRAWNAMFLHANFTQAFIRRYRTHRTHILWSQQIYQLPIVTEYIAQVQKEAAKYEEGQQLQDELKKVKRKITHLKHDRGNEAKQRRRELKRMKSTLRQGLRECDTQRFSHHREASQIRSNFIRDSTGSQARRQTRQRPCITENCKGFLDSKGDCPVCKNTTCLECNVKKVDQNHVCTQVDIDTWNDLKKNTRPCPGCHTRIFKISGCDQMFCIQCNTAFSWTRGTIETGAIHNPHYFEWLFDQRGQGGARREEGGGNNCNDDRLPDFFRISTRMNSPLQEQQIVDRFQKIRHFQHVVMPRFLTDPNGHRRQIFQYLHKYLMNDNRAPKKFEECMQRFETDNEIYEVLNSYRRIQTHLFRTFANGRISGEEFLAQFNDCRDYYRDVIRNTAKIYKRTIRVDHVFE